MIYEHITSNYYYEISGDFKLVVDKSTGYFNATKLCDAGGKRFRDWKRKNMHIDFYEIKGDNNDKIERRITGTYVSKELILDIASYLGDEFYNIINGSDFLIKKKDELMDIFTFVKDYNLAFDITSDWFQNLWYPLSKNQETKKINNNFQQVHGGLKKVENQPGDEIHLEGLTSSTMELKRIEFNH